MNKLSIMKLRARNIPTKMNSQWDWENKVLKKENEQLIDQISNQVSVLDTVVKQRDTAVINASKSLDLYEQAKDDIIKLKTENHDLRMHIAELKLYDNTRSNLA